MFEIAGLVVSGISLLNELVSRYQDLTSWAQTDLPVDSEWLDLAISKGVLEGRAQDYTWSAEDKVATRELHGTHRVVMPYNAERKVKYRICRGRPGDRLILMKKSASDAESG